MTDDADLLTLTEASASSGIPANTLHVAIFQDRLKGVKGHFSPHKPGALVWAISKADLDDFARHHKPKGNRKYWTASDYEAIHDLQESCTDLQLAAYLGVSVGALRQNVTKARRRGLLKRSRSRRNRSPFVIPASAVLLAKSCEKCGKLRDANYFRRYTTGSNVGCYDSGCHLCNVAQGKRKYKKLKEIDPQANTNTGTLHALLQRVTQEKAGRSNIPYTSAEMELIEDPGKSTLEVALELGRTFYAIRNRRYVNGVPDQRFSDVFTHRQRRAKLPDSHWVIHFPAAAQALREHFRKLGEPVPEELWEWTDEKEMAS